LPCARAQLAHARPAIDLRSILAAKKSIPEQQVDAGKKKRENR